jgi:microcystin-dependent protein
MSEPFLAEIKIFAGNFAPRGFAFCNGALLQIAQNTALFSLIGTFYGGDGRTTVGLPDLQNRAPMHPGNGPGLTSRRLGERGGSETVTMVDSNLPSHSHSVHAVSGSPPDTNSPDNAYPGAAPMYANGGLSALSSDAIENAGRDTPDALENRQPFLELNFIIALTGIYPSRS